MTIYSLSHKQRVCLLFKSILRLHRSLPSELKTLGDSYAKEEFRRHKNVPMDQALKFMSEWSRYAKTLSTQLSSEKNQTIGAPLADNVLDQFSEEQLNNLYELYKETKGQDM